MSTLEIACGRCNKRFRVRAEFAGKTTRCPSCSAPLIVGATSAPIPTPQEDDEGPRRRRPREEEERPPEPQEDWRAVDTALRREQTCLLFVGLQVFADLLLFCVLRLMGGGADAGNPVILLVVLLLSIGPSLGAAGLGLMARGSALGAPPLARAKGTAIASMCCGIAALLSLLAFGIGILMSMDGPNRVHEDMMMMPLVGVLVAGIAALLTFGVYTIQVGIVRQSREVSTAVGRMAIGGTVSVVLLVAGACLILFLSFAFASPPQRHTGYGYQPYNYQSDREEMMLAFLLIAVLPITIIVMLILYHRLLAAGRRAISPYGERG